MRLEFSWLVPAKPSWYLTYPFIHSNRFEAGAHPREPIIDLLGLTACQTSSLEDHGRQLSKTINYYTQKISSAKAVGAVVKALSPSIVSASSVVPTSRRDAPAASQSMSINSVNSDTSFVNVGGSANGGGGGANNVSDLDKVEKKLADLKTSIMDKVAPSSTWQRIFGVAFNVPPLPSLFFLWSEWFEKLSII